MERMESFDTPADTSFDYMYKVLIVGNSGVGKTAFLMRYCDDTFSQSFVATVGIDFKVKNMYRSATVRHREREGEGGRERDPIELKHFSLNKLLLGAFMFVNSGVIPFPVRLHSQ